jgi:DHA3 family macrolide efflux protein-like MFS transporter
MPGSIDGGSPEHGVKESRRYLPLYLLTLFWAAQAISLFGDRLNNFSLVALINRFEENPGLTLSKVYLAMYLPIFVLAPLIGVLIDRLNKRWVLVLTDIVRGLLVIIIPPLYIGTGSFLPVLGIVFLLATGNLFFLPAKSGLIPEIVPENRLVRINSTLWIAGIVGVIGGFLGGGLIFDYLSWPTCFYLDGLTYFLSAALLVAVALHKPEDTAPASHIERRTPSLVSAVREGIRGMKDNPEILGPLGYQALVFFAAGGFSVLAIVLIKRASPPDSSLGLSAVGLAVGLGMAVGSIIANRLPTESQRRRRFEALFFALFVPSTAAIAGGGLILISAGAFTAGLSAAPIMIVSESQLQRTILSSMRGRIFSFREILTRSLFLLSAFLFTWLGEFADKGLLMFMLGLFLALSGVFWIAARAVNVR